MEVMGMFSPLAGRQRRPSDSAACLFPFPFLFLESAGGERANLAARPCRRRNSLVRPGGCGLPGAGEAQAEDHD